MDGAGRPCRAHRRLSTLSALTRVCASLCVYVCMRVFVCVRVSVCAWDGPQGGDADASDLAKLRALRVRYIVNVARECANHHAALPEFVYMHVAADDQIDSPEAFEHEVSAVCRFITQARRAGDGNVFVHCRAGISRSATVVIAYLVQEEHWALREAIDHVRAARPSVAPNLGFLMMLMSIEHRVHGSDSLARLGAASSGGDTDNAMHLTMAEQVPAPAPATAATVPIATDSTAGGGTRSPRGSNGSYPDSPKAAAAVAATLVRSP
jgi:protein-tyrosine phosphatase